MSIEEVSKALLDLQIHDERIQISGECRYAAKRMYEIAKRADKTPPITIIEIVVWRSENTPTSDENVHFALKVSNDNKRLLFNPSPTALFPQYNGHTYNAPGFLKKMKPTEELNDIP